jgi:uncharacterized SAM-binding protein YcdF (DUF218 family)
MSGTSKDSSTATPDSPVVQAAPPRAFWGLFYRKERWSLSWRGRLILASALLLVGALLLKGVYPFLATTHRVDADVLVVEGWVHGYAIRAAVEEFRRGSYQRIFTTGGPVEGSGGYVNDYQTEASVGAELLTKNGVPIESVEMVPSRVMNRDRTYGAGVALRNWFRGHNFVARSLNVLTEDVHARRSRLLFQEALGKDIKVGIISVPNPDYDSRHWWRYSAGVKDISSETIAYVYAKFLFYPSESSRGEKAFASGLANSKP